MKLIGLTGTAGAGKSTVAEIICKEYDFHEVSTSEFVRHLTRFVYDLPSSRSPARDELYDVATFMRATVSAASSVEFCIKRAQALGYNRVLITGLRTMGEAHAVRKHGGLLVAVDADSKVRYKRITARQRDSEANKSYQQFVVQDEKENKGLASQGDARGINYIVQHADEVILNDTNVNSLHNKVSDTLKSHIL